MNTWRLRWVLVSLLMLAAVLILSIGKTTAPSRAAPVTLYRVEGRVYVGATGLEPPQSAPLEGVTVTLYCAANPGDQGASLRTTTTNDEGWYGLPISDSVGCEYLNIIETDPPGYTSNGATTVSGTVKSANWIQYDLTTHSLSELTLTGNKFWDAPPPMTTTCTSCTDCSNKLHGLYATVQLANDINTVGTQCVKIDADNVTFDCQGHTIHATTRPEFSYGIGVASQSNVTVTGCTISGFRTGIQLDSVTSSALLTNTITDVDRGIVLNASDGNLLAGNHISQTMVGVSMAWSDANGFRNNRLCKQTTQDIKSVTSSTGNTRLGNTCDSIYNWNGDDSISYCILNCTPNTTTTCSDPSSCQGTLNGDYGTITLTKDLVAPGGITVTGNHLTFDCDHHQITGGGSGVGILLDSKVGVQIKNCTIRKFGTGIELRSASHNTIMDDTLISNTVGLHLMTTDKLVQPDWNTIYNLEARDNSRYGVWLSGGTANSVSASDLRDNGEYALWVDGPCDNTVSGSLAGRGGTLLYWHDITAPASVPTGTYGAVVLCNVAHTTVESITVSNGNSKNDGIVVITSTDVTLRHNDLTASRGIVLVDTDHSEVFTNTVTGSSAAGITLRHAPYNDVLSNTVSSNGSDGILVTDGADHATLSGNTAELNQRAGIRVLDSDYVEVRGNTVAENEEDGIALEAATGSVVLENDVLANQHGLYLDSHTSSASVNQNRFCRNEGQDIYNSGTSNSGDNNACTYTYGWNDAGETGGCTRQCVGWYNRRWGFSFHNPTYDDLSWTRYWQTFGKDEVYITAKLCIGVPVCIPFKCWCLGKKVDVVTYVPDPLAAILYAAPYKDLAEPGSCYGMSGSSLQFYYGDDHPSAYDPSATQVRDLKLTSAHGPHDLEDHIQIIHGSQMSSEAIGVYLGEMSAGQAEANAVLARARSGLAAGQPGFLVIKDGLTAGHAMNYDTVVDIDSSTSRIYLYDNNKEHFVTKVYRSDSAYPSLVIDRNANDWSYVMAGGSTWSDDYIFDMPYGVVNRSDWSLPGSANGLLNMITGSASGNIEDMSGRLIGYDTSGHPHEEIPGGMALPILGATSDRPLGYLVQPGDYTMNIYGDGTPYNALMLGFNGGYVLEGITTTSGITDRLAFRVVNGNPYHNELGFTTTGPAKDLNVRLLRRWSPDSDRRLYWMRGMTVDAQSRLFFKVTPDHQGVVIANRGDAPVDYEVLFQNEIVTDSLSNSPRTKIIADQTIQPGETHMLKPLNWGDLSTSPVVQTQASCGDAICGEGEDHVNCAADCVEQTCVVPHDDMRLTTDTLLCQGIYELPDAGDPGVLIIDHDDVILDCNGARLIGDNSGVGILDVGHRNVTLRNCSIEHYEQGVVLLEDQDVRLTDSQMMDNTGFGMFASAAQDLHLEENLITRNNTGVRIAMSSGVAVERTYMCGNFDADISSEDNADTDGSQNACESSFGWQDTGQPACTYACGPNIQMVPSVFLPLVLRE